MKSHLLFWLCICTILLQCSSLHAQAQPSVEWQRCLGGSSGEEAFGLTITADGGYVLTGTTSSLDGDVGEIQGLADLWVVKLDSSGELIWEQTYGGSSDERGYDIQQTMDGGFIICGSTSSEDGDITVSYGAGDIWVLKLDSLGLLEWQRSIGGSASDAAYGIRQLFDGSYMLTGWTFSNDGTITGNHGGRDALLAHLSAEGEVLGAYCIGGEGNDGARSMELTSDGAVVLAGWSNTNTFPDEGIFGADELWVVKLDLDGIVQWEQFIGGDGDDQGYKVIESSTGELIVVGQHNSLNADGTAWQTDAWVVALDMEGQLVWEQQFGGDNHDNAFSIVQNSSGGFLVAGITLSTDGDVSGNHGNADGWLFSLDDEHQLLWQRCIGGSSDDLLRSLVADSNGAISVVGRTLSNDGDISGNHGNVDVLVMKFHERSNGMEKPSEAFHFCIFPNPVSDYLTVELDLPFPSQTELEIIDISGRVILQVPLGRQQHLRKKLDIGNLAKGVYQLVLHLDGKPRNHRFIKS